MTSESRPKTAPATPQQVDPTVSPLTTRPCPDCGAAYDAERHLTHLDTCPLGHSLDESSDADREWFEQHPHAVAYCRPLSMCDRDTVLSSLPDGARIVAGKTRVTQLAPGVRVREHVGLVVVVGSKVRR